MLKANDTLVSLDNAGLSRGGRWIVRGVGLSVARGEIVTIIGPNGSGKSSSARMALGVIAPDEGSAHVREGVVIGYVPQNLAIDWTLPLSVERFMHLTAGVSVDAAHKALERTGTLGLLHEEVRTLSGGEFQRVLLARAIARKPDLLVLDEPVQGVDFSGQIALYELIRQVRDETGCGVLLVSHDLHVVMAATDKVICLNGHVCCHGTPKAVASSAAYRDLFGERAVPTLAVYEHHHDHVHLPDGRVRHADGSVTDHCHPGDGHHHDGNHHSDADDQTEGDKRHAG